MTNINLARGYMIKIKTRLEVLEIYLKKEDYSDVIREAQEIVELAQKAMLREVGILTLQSGMMWVLLSLNIKRNFLKRSIKTFQRLQRYQNG